MYRKNFLNLFTAIAMFAMTFSQAGVASAARMDLGGEDEDNFWVIDTTYCKDGFSLTVTHTQLGDDGLAFWLELGSSSIPVMVETAVDLREPTNPPEAPALARIAHGDGSSKINAGQPFTVNFFFAAPQATGTPIAITIERWDHGNMTYHEVNADGSDESPSDDLETDAQVVGNCLLDTTVPVAVIAVTPASIQEGETALVTVSLNNIPAAGYTSAEFTCHYDTSLVEISDIALTDLFGVDAATVTTAAQNGSFIVAIAGSNGRKAVSDGVAFTFDAKSLQAGSASIDCTPRISKGDNVLTFLPSSGAVLTTPSNTPPPVNSGLLNGHVLASKSVTINAYRVDSTSAASVTVNPNDSFSFAVPVDIYTVIATASGYLSARASVIITDGSTATLSTITLLAGDIDNNNVIDQFDAMTIGMSYNMSTPPAADLNNDSTINVLDLELLAHNYRMTGPVVWQVEKLGAASVPVNPSFAADVTPIFNDDCSACHGASGDWDAASYQTVMTSGSHAPVIVAHDATNSLLVRRISGNLGAIMPPAGKLPDVEIQTIMNWINMGAQDN